MHMDGTDKKLITLIQADFPIEERPYAAVGEKLGIPEQEVIDRINAIMESGEIRRLGASFDSRKVGYTSTLCAGVACRWRRRTGEGAGPGRKSQHQDCRHD